MSEKTVYQKLSEARFKLQQKKLKKSGKNKYSGFDYFELSDFLPSINEIFNEVGLCSQFYITPTKADENTGEVIEIAVLNVINAEKADEVIQFKSPVDEAGMKGASPIQQLGAKHTYMRRYLWLEAMEICEHDEVDGTSGKGQEMAKNVTPTASTRTASEMQVRLLNEYYQGDNLKKLLEMNNISKLEEMPMIKASELIKKCKEREKK